MAKETINGVPVSDDPIEAWADEAERGLAVEQLRKRGRRPLAAGPSEVVPVRMDATLLAGLAARADRDHISRSEAIRAAVRAWLDATA
ncbi:CopG family transcriptional regulator [Frondihabitans sp. PAMC 28766]|nr:ribbon-helix-helix protein, CopG family [Frondihabitans sp. PAMC 28766]AMM22118.1 CopG family transcriptional regulator [Frondihabitans sp. PAMC 28766]